MSSFLGSNYLIGNAADRWHGFMRHEHFLGGADYITRQYETFRPNKQKLLDKMMAKWYTLPKVEPTAE